MNDDTLWMLFEQWHRDTNQYKKYHLSHAKSFGVDGQVTYRDNRTNWAFLAFKGGYNFHKNEVKN